MTIENAKKYLKENGYKIKQLPRGTWVVTSKTGRIYDSKSLNEIIKIIKF